MTNYSKSGPNAFSISGLTKESTNNSVAVKVATDLGLFNPETDGWLLNVEVHEGLRRNGLGAELVEEFHTLCRKQELTRVLCVISSTEDQQEILEEWYHKRLGYKIEVHEYDGVPFVFGIKVL